ncbi:MAG: hypothetical protein Q9204_004551 [Flavoplaca sp. TL-2023a]
MATLQFSQHGESPPKLVHRNKQLLNNIVDGTARTRPSATYAEVPRSFHSYESGYRKITYRALANAVNGVAWWLQQELGLGQDHQTLAYLGPNDLTYVMIILGAVKAGYTRLKADHELTLGEDTSNQTTVITPLAGVIPSAQVIIDGLKLAKADAVFLAPPFLEQIAKDQDMSKMIGDNVDTVIYGGGDVSQWTGDALASRVQLFNFNGSTETGSYPLLRPSGPFPFEDWKYIQPHPAGGLDFRPSVHGLFEAVIIRNEVYEDEQPVFKVFPHLSEYPTKDLWAPHPKKKGLWTYRGRADDTIVFKPGYMCDPVPMEQMVTQHADVRAVLMAGTGRFRPALIVERAGDGPYSFESEQMLTSQVWPLVEEANKMYQLGARVARSHILFTDPEQPMRRAGKGTVQRGPTLQLYKDKLDQLYEREGDAVPGNELVLPSSSIV